MKLLDITEELKFIRSDLAESQEHLKALEEGKTFTPSQPKKKDTNGAKKRKNSRGGKGGSPKRRRGGFDTDEETEMDLDPDADEDEDLDDFIDDESVKSANSDDDSDKEDSSDNEDSDKSDNESDVSAEENDQDALGIDDVKAVIEQKKADLKSARERLSEARKERKEAMDMISSLTKRQNKVQKDKNAFCSLKRSEVRLYIALLALLTPFLVLTRRAQRRFPKWIEGEYKVPTNFVTHLTRAC